MYICLSFCAVIYVWRLMDENTNCSYIAHTFGSWSYNVTVTSIIHKEPEIMSCFAVLIVLIAGWESEILPTDWGEKHPDGRVWKSHPAKRRRDNPSEREFIKVTYCIHNHTFWTKLNLCKENVSHPICVDQYVYFFFTVPFSVLN